MYRIRTTHDIALRKNFPLLVLLLTKGLEKESVSMTRAEKVMNVLSPTVRSELIQRLSAQRNLSTPPSMISGFRYLSIIFMSMSGRLEIESDSRPVRMSVSVLTRGNQDIEESCDIAFPATETKTHSFWAYKVCVCINIPIA